MNEKLKKYLLPILVIIIFCCVLVLNRGMPENPLNKEAENVSKMYTVNTVLAYDQENFPVTENANISVAAHEDGITEQSHENGKNRQEEQKEESEEISEDESGEQQRDDDTSLPQKQEPKGDGASLLTLINQKPSDEQESGNGNHSDGDVSDSESTGGSGEGNTQNQGAGGSGGESINIGENAFEELFTTTIDDGSTQSDKKYPFDILLTSRGKSLKLISRVVETNGQLKSFKTNSVFSNLREGRNTIKVTLRFRDDKYNEIVAASGVYTVFYVPDTHYLILVQNINTGEFLENNFSYDVNEKELGIRVISQKGKKSVKAFLRLNNFSKEVDNNGIYNLRLKVGENKLTVRTGTGINQIDNVYYINYHPSKFAISFESDAITETIKGVRGEGGYTNFEHTSSGTYYSDDMAFSFRISHTKNTGNEELRHIYMTTRHGTSDIKYLIGANGYATVNLDPTRKGTTFKAVFTDDEGQEHSYSWLIYYKRLHTPKDKEPVIQAALADKETVHNNHYIIPISATDWKGNALYPDSFQVFVNDKLYDYSGIDGTVFEYNVNFDPGRNNIKIIVWDEEQYTASKELAVFYSPEEDEATVNVVVSAANVGLGSLISKTVTVPASYTVAEVIEEQLALHGFTTTHDGSSVDANYYLAAISKEGFTDGVNITPEQIEAYESEGVMVNPNAFTTGRLSEFDFTRTSGWMITLNDYFIAQGMGTRPIRDGDSIFVGFTLDLGHDLGKTENSGIYGD